MTLSTNTGLSYADSTTDSSLEKKIMPAGNRNRLSSTTSTTATSAVTQGITFWSPKTNGYTDIEVQLDNFMYQANGAPLTSGLTAISVTKFAVEYPIGGTITPMYLSNHNGVSQDKTERGVTLQPGEYGKWFATVKIPRNAQFRIRFYRSFVGGSSPWTYPLNQLTTAGKNDGFSLSDAVDSGSLTLYAAATQLFGPTLVKGTPDVAGIPRVAFVGDSRMAGSGATSDPWGGITVQGDWISNSFLNAFPYENKGNLSWAELAFGNELPYLNLGIASAQAGSWTAANRANELRMLQEIDATDIILDLCINDLLTGSTGSSCITRIMAIIALLRETLPNVKIGVVTPLPVSNSSDGYATLANQSLSGTLAGGGTPSNWALFTDNAGASGRSQVLAAIRNNTIGADYIIDVSAWLSDPTDERYWNTLYGVPTGDGIHQNNPMHHRGRQALNLQKILGITPESVNTRKNQLTGTVYLGNLDKVVPVSTVSAVATIYLPRVPLLEQSHIISDAGGNAGTNNITVNDADGNLVTTISTNSASVNCVYVAGSTAHKWVVL